MINGMPSLYGSHKSMTVDPIEEDTLLGVDRIIQGERLLRDENGLYTTTADRLDTGLADPNRYTKSKRVC